MVLNSLFGNIISFHVMIVTSTKREAGQRLVLLVAEII